MRLPSARWGLSVLAAACLVASAQAQTDRSSQGRENPENSAVKGDMQQSGTEPPHHNAGPTADSTPAAPIGSGPGTIPAKIDENVAALDRIPIMARPLPLTDEQRRQIYDQVMSNDQIPMTQTTAKPATILPGSVELSELSPALDDQIPVVRGYKYVKLPDRVLVVSPPNRVVVGEIRR
jgi:hypothetical protein